MLTVTPTMVNISELRQRQNELLARLSDGPLLLTQYSKPAAVLVKPELWNQLIEELDELEDTVAALKAELALATGEDELEDWEDEPEDELVPVAP